MHIWPDHRVVNHIFEWEPVVEGHEEGQGRIVLRRICTEQRLQDINVKKQ